jgi:putative transposase
VPRTSAYNKPKPRSPEAATREDAAKKRIDYWHTVMPYLGARKLCAKLRGDGIQIGRKLVRRYMEEMGIKAIYPKPNLSKRAKGKRPAPYLLKNMKIYLPNQVWAIDITYIPLRQGHMYLTVIIDWHSRYIIGWALSDTLETANVVHAVSDAIEACGTPAIINSDQGSQFTSDEYRSLLAAHGIRQSMDGKARWVDNVVIERWFRSLKVECVYINEYDSPRALSVGIRQYVKEYNHLRPHQSFGYKLPAAVYAEAFGYAAV